MWCVLVFVKPMNTIVLNTINHSEIGVICTNWTLSWGLHIVGILKDCIVQYNFKSPFFMHQPKDRMTNAQIFLQHLLVVESPDWIFSSASSPLHSSSLSFQFFVAPGEQILPILDTVQKMTNYLLVSRYSHWYQKTKALKYPSKIDLANMTDKTEDDAL